MSDNPSSSNFAGTLSSGIQDVAALLPLLGTEQCERHVADALRKGYLYAAILSVSIFGSLGVVKVAFAVWLASITYPFFGGRWLEDAGFHTASSVASMVTIAKDTGRYGAEIAVEKLLKEQNITDVSLVKEFTISDGRRTEFKEGIAQSSGSAAPQSSGDAPSQSSSGSQEKTVSPTPGTVQPSGNATSQASPGSQAKNVPPTTGTEQPAANGASESSSGSQEGKTSTTLGKSWIGMAMSKLPWNTMLIICSLMSAVVGVTPYLYLMDNVWNEPLSWLFPLLRSFGTSLCVVVIQLALQRRIHRLANLSLEWRKLQQADRSVVDTELSEQLVLEQRICKHLNLEPNSPLKVLRHLIPSFPRRSPKPPTDVERAGQAPDSSHSAEAQTQGHPTKGPENPRDECRIFEELLSPDWTLMLYQLALAVGMGMTVTGYVGCFSLVGQTSVKNGPYVWFGLETALSLLRIIVWGWNPKWDEGTGLSMSLRLREMRDPTVDVEDEFIHVTSPYSQYDLKLARQYGDYVDTPQSFIAYNEESFLGKVTPWVGPLRPLGSPLVTLFYSILFNSDDRRKELYTTVYFTDSRPTLTFSINKPDVIFSSTFETNLITRAVQITVANEAMKDADSFINSLLHSQIKEHCWNLRRRLFRRQRIEDLAVMWNGSVESLPIEHSSHTSVDSKELSKYDRKYIALREAWTAKTKYCQGRQGILEQLKNDDEYCKKEVEWGRPASVFTEALFIAESAILEIQLWGEEKGLESTLAECIRTLPLRISAEKKRAVERYSSHKWDTKGLTHQWDYMQTMLVELRQSEKNHGIARKILSGDWSVDDLARHLENLFPFSFLPLCLQGCASIPSTAVDVTPTPEQKLYAIFHLWTKRIKIILSKGGLDTTLRKSLLLPDSAAWGPYVNISSSISDYASHVRSVLADSHHVLELGYDFTTNLQHSTLGEEGGERRDNPGRGEEGSVEGGTGMTKIITLNSLTTLIFTHYPNDEHRKAITNIVKRAPNIICLAGTRCHTPGQHCTQQHCQSVLANRQDWKNGVRDKPSFQYRVGFEGHCREDVKANGDHIRIQDTGSCFALFFCPSPGELKITFNARRRSKSVQLEAMLVSDDGSEIALNYEIPIREKKGELERVTFSFPNVPKGTGSISVKGDTGNWRKGWKIHGLVTLEWISFNNDENTERTEDRVLEGSSSAASKEQRNNVNEEELIDQAQSTGKSANLDPSAISVGSRVRARDDQLVEDDETKITAATSATDSKTA